MSWNGSVCNFGNVLPPTTKLTAVWSPMCYLLWEPDENTLGSGNPGAFEYDDCSNFPSSPPTGGEGIGPLHDKNGNILALDGHVDFMATNQFRTLSQNYGSGPDRRGLLWWAYVGSQRRRRIDLISSRPGAKGPLALSYWYPKKFCFLANTFTPLIFRAEPQSPQRRIIESAFSARSAALRETRFSATQ